MPKGHISKKLCPKCKERLPNGVRLCGCGHAFYSPQVHPEKRRQKISGAGNGNSSLTEADVRAIREAYRLPSWNEDRTVFTQGNISELMKRYNVGRSAIRFIVDGTTWGWLD